MIYHCKNFVFLYNNAIYTFRFIIINKKNCILKKKFSFNIRCIIFTVDHQGIFSMWPSLSSLQNNYQNLKEKFFINVYRSCSGIFCDYERGSSLQLKYKPTKQDALQLKVHSDEEYDQNDSEGYPKKNISAEVYLEPC